MSDVLQGKGLVGLTEIEAASRRLAGIVAPTPLLPADAMSEAVEAKVRLKCESLQRTGSFKIRGAYNFVSQLSDDQVSEGIITYSSGNHAQAVALAGRLRNLRVVVVMPVDAPKVKRDGAQRLGAELVFEGTTSVERRARAEGIAEHEGLVIVPPFDHRHIIAGQGTVGLEIARDWPDVDVVLAPIGGGGLVSGVAAAVKRALPRARVVGVEPEGAASMRKALDHDAPTLLEEIDTIADGLKPVIAGELTFEHVRELVDDVVTVDDASIREATARLVHGQKLVVEYSGAATTAALLSGAVKPEGGRVAAIVSGGNLDPGLLSTLA
ncbi:MAG: threonine/serine dehydratase [Longimicrobiales bacterium]|nr:threonine/serine dehydratase [Longimicrobiales bacterium]